MLHAVNIQVIKFYLILSISVYGQYVRTARLYSSLDVSNREFVCPQESVIVTCTVDGTSLQWEVLQEGDTQFQQIISFERTARAQEGFLNEIQFSCFGVIFFSGLLENRTRNYTSSMIVRPRTWSVPSRCDPLTISCKTLDDGAEANSKNVTYKVASESMQLLK